MSFYAILQWYVHGFTHEMQRLYFVHYQNELLLRLYASYLISERSCNFLKETIIWKASRQEMIKRGWTFVMKTSNWDHCIWLSDSSAGTSVPNGGDSFLINSCIINHTQKCYTENQSCWGFFSLQRSIFNVSHATCTIPNNEQWHWAADR